MKILMAYYLQKCIAIYVLILCRYVQRVIEDESNLIYSWMERGCCIYVAGSANNMPAAVRSAFVTIAQKVGRLSPEEAEQFIGSMETQNRYQTETWS